MYTKNEWQNGDVITKSKLDHLEDGVYDASDVSSVISVGSVKPVNSVAVIAYISSLDANAEEY